MSPLFDDATLQALKADLGEEDTREALEMFLADAAEKMARLQSRGGDRPLVKLQAHSIKSSAATLGFTELARLARVLEPKAATLEPAQLAQAIRELLQAFAAAHEFARARLLANSPQG